MIQDIKPHIYNNHYEEYKPSENDFCFCINDGAVLLYEDLKDKNCFVPTFKELKESTDESTYLFSIDDKRYFLKQIKEKNIYKEGIWAERTSLRTVMPRVTAFASVTALQLDGWYKNNCFCGRCGSRMKKDHKERMVYCTECGNEVYPRINPAVIIGVTNGSKLLMTKYAKRKYTRYALVAGFTEIGETLEETVAREVMEETGIRVKNIRYYKSQPWSFTDTLLTGFFCEADEDVNIKLDEEELSIAQWIDRADIDKIQDSYDDISLTNEMICYFRDNKEMF